ncbi:SGNH/GDSL hydrolase family protein [Candidatus Gottesmanbacteria bacterium]|nr:SGNH/GDSL hydrolase family protein [Candidatus Gottesmanbacteria bacterium]
MKKTHTIAIRIGITLISIICTFTLLEFVSRNILPKPQSIAIENLHIGPTGDGPVLDKIGLTAPDIFYRTPTGLRLRPNVRGVIDGHDLSKKRITFSTNSLGYRHKELGPKTDADVRILTLGDSITFQEYLPLEETYPYHVETYIRENLPPTLSGKRVDVINAGVGMIGSENELAILTETGLSVSPDVVLVEMYLNDARESFSLKLIKTPPLIQKSYLINSLVHTINLLRKKQLEHQATNEEVNQEGIRFMAQNPVDPTSSAAWKTNTPAFHRLIAEYFQD